jgi:general secretion pathway protein C
MQCASGMMELIERRSWVLWVVVVVACSTFAAKAIGHVLEASYLGDPERGPVISPIAIVQDRGPLVRSNDDASLLLGRLFCSVCSPGAEVTTTLPLVLLATSISQIPSRSSATIVNTENLRQGAYAIGDRPPGVDGVLTAIHYRYVEIERTGRTERILLADPGRPLAFPPRRDPGTIDAKQAAIDAGVRSIDDTHYEIDKSLVDQVLANPMAWLRGGRVIPNVTGGVRLYAIRPSSVFARLGLSNGDSIQAINGFELSSLDKGLEMFAKLREATFLEVEVRRRGQPITIHYTIR